MDRILNFLSNAPVRIKIASCFILLMGIFILLGFYIKKNTDLIHNEVVNLTDSSLPSLTAIANIYDGISDSRREQFQALSYADDTLKNNNLELAHANLESVDEVIKKYSSYISSEKEQIEFNDLKKYLSIYKSNIEVFHENFLVNNIDGAKKILNETNNDFKKIHSILKNLYAINKGYISNNKKDIIFSINKTVNGTIVCILVMISILFVFNILLSRQICRPLMLISKLAEAISNGNLSYEFDRHLIPNNEFGKLADVSLKMQNNLHMLINDITNVVHKLNLSVSDVSDISGVSLSGMKNQQDEVRLIATAMEEMRVTVAEVAINTEESSSSAYDANKETKEGTIEIKSTINHIGKVSVEIERAEELVTKLEKEAKSINTVVDVISSIAGQTNLLALNAAIEAARAGENGRGFSVVADEVRVLAGKTQQSTIEIIDMIENLQNSANLVRDVTNICGELIKSCVQQSHQTEFKIKLVEEKVNKIAEMSTQIATACSQQDSVTEELGRNIEKINQSASDVVNGALLTEKSCVELNDLTAILQNAVGKFN